MKRGPQPRERQLLDMRTSGLTVGQIAMRTGLMRATVRVTISKARRKLKDIAAAAAVFAVDDTGT